MKTIKCMHYKDEYTNFTCPTDAVKAEVGPDFRPESSWCIS